MSWSALQPFTVAPASHGRPWVRLGATAWAAVGRGVRLGGTVWRFTPMVNWYLSDNIRFELAYGYGSLDRFGLDGTTHFFQSRIQLLF